MSVQIIPNLYSNQRLNQSLIWSMCLSLILTLGGFQTTWAKKKKKKKTNVVTKSIQPLQWGNSLNTVKSYLKKEFKKQYQDSITSARDDLEIDRLRKELKNKIKRMEKGYIEFQGQRTGYEISILQNDFIHQDQESMLKVDEDGKQRYYFFKGNQLWKIIVSHPSYTMSSFAGFVRVIRRKMGKPFDLEVVGKGKNKTILSASWKDKDSSLIVEDQSDRYQKYTLKYVAMGRGESIEEHVRKTQAEQAKNKPKKRLNQINIFEEDDDDSNVVDKITGSESTVDLEKKYEID